MRILGAARLSHDTDESTSIARQRESIELTTRARGDTLVHVTEDTDVSGAVAPSSRAGLGPWLTDPARIDQWDGLMVAKLDRLTRSLRDFDDLRIWCDEQGKTLISVAESIDLSTSIGRMFANLLAMFAQFERERMGERRADAARKARREGRWDGRAIPFGYMVGEHNRYAQDPVYGPLAAGMAALRIDGHSLSWIARSLTERGVPPRGGATEWRADKVQKILANPSLNGQITSDGRVLRGDDGRPLKFIDDPILTDDQWSLLQDAMKTRPRGERAGGFLLAGIACCQCGRPLYGNRKPGNRQSVYRCSTGATDHQKWCGARVIPAADLEAMVEAKVLAVWGDRELYRRTVTPAKDYRNALEVVSRRIADIEAEVVTGILPASSAGRMLASLEAERERLEALPVESAKEDWEPAGITVRQYLAGLSPEDLSRTLRLWGVRVMAWRDQAGEWGSPKGEVHVIVSHGQPQGFEQASGLLLPHLPEDHEPLYEVAGVLVRRHEDGAFEAVRDPEKPALLAAIKDRVKPKP